MAFKLPSFKVPDIGGIKSDLMSKASGALGSLGLDKVNSTVTKTINEKKQEAMSLFGLDGIKADLMSNLKDFTGSVGISDVSSILSDSINDSLGNFTKLDGVSTELSNMTSSLGDYTSMIDKVNLKDFIK